MNGYITGEGIMHAHCINCGKDFRQVMMLRISGGYVCAECHELALKQVGKLAVIEEYHRLMEKERKEDGS